MMSQCILSTERFGYSLQTYGFTPSWC